MTNDERLIVLNYLYEHKGESIYKENMSKGLGYSKERFDEFLGILNAEGLTKTTKLDVEITDNGCQWLEDFFTIRNNTTDDTITSKKELITPKTSNLDKAAIIITIIAGLMAIYEFIIKHWLPQK